MTCQWYITAAAARLARDVDGRTRTQLWRVSWPVRGQTARLELIVSVDPRPEGPLPALISVRAKRRGGAKHRPAGG